MQNRERLPHPNSMTQAPLDFPFRPSYRREDFIIAPCNQEAYQWIMAWPNWPDKVFYLHGPQGSGKKHLAHIWAAVSGARFLLQPDEVEKILSVTYQESAFVLDLALIALPEQAFFHLLNHIRENNKGLLIIANSAPKQLSYVLPDLNSRLAALPSAALKEPDEELITALIFKLFSDRQLQVSEDVVRYLLPRIERTFPAIHSIVEQIDEEALRLQQNITIPLIRDIFRHASE